MSRGEPQHRALFIDDEHVTRMTGLKRTVHQPAPHADNPVLAPEAPWELGLLSHIGQVIFDEAHGEFRYWYLAKPPPDAVIDGRRPEGVRSLLCLATSDDGLRWRRPSLGQVEFNGSRANNIVRIGSVNCEGAAVLPDLADPDPRRRYKALFWEHGSGGMKKRDDGLVLWADGGSDGIWVAFSPDGIDWTNDEGSPVLRTWSDSPHSVVIDPRTGRYVGYGRFGFGRSIARIESDDFRHWSAPQLVLEPDEREPAGPFPDTQFYGMPVDLYEGLYVGALWIYREGTDGTIDTQLASSRDGIRWTRVADRQTFLPLGLRNGPADGMVRAAASYIVRGDRIFIYYGQTNGPHAGPKFPRESIRRLHKESIALGILRRDGFVSLDAGDEEGYVLTRPNQFGDSTSLHLNVAVADGGGCTVAVCDTWGSADPRAVAGEFPGFARSEPIADDRLDIEARWPDAQLAQLRGHHGRLRIHLRNAKLFSYWLS